jgi:hypothetical protein
MAKLLASQAIIGDPGESCILATFQSTAAALRF